MTSADDVSLKHGESGDEDGSHADGASLTQGLTELESAPLPEVRPHASVLLRKRQEQLQREREGQQQQEQQQQQQQQHQQESQSQKGQSEGQHQQDQGKQGGESDTVPPSATVSKDAHAIATEPPAAADTLESLPSEPATKVGSASDNAGSGEEKSEVCLDVWWLLLVRISLSPVPFFSCRECFG